MEKLILQKLLTIFYLINLLQLLPETSGLMPDLNTKTWTFELRSVSTKTSDPEKLQIHLEIIRISRGVFALTGEAHLNFDVVEGDSNYISGKCYRSAHGVNDYRLLPFQMPRTHFFDVLNTYYKNMIMDSLRNCSNLPIFEDKFQPPLEKKIYKMNGCSLSADGLPNHMQEGFYKVIVTGTGDVDYEIELISEAISVL